MKNEKLISTNPLIWSNYRGFSLFFDGENKKNARVETYKKIGEFVAKLEGKNFNIGIHDPNMYHVTAWDGINDTNFNQIYENSKREVSSILSGLPLSLKVENIVSRRIFASSLYKMHHEITFEVDCLSIERNKVLVIKLNPIKKCLNDYQRFLNFRIILNKDFNKCFGINFFDNYTAHITLGNFLNVQSAKDAKKHLDEWNESASSKLVGLKVPFNEIAIYSFFNMGKFTKIQPEFI